MTVFMSISHIKLTAVFTTEYTHTHIHYTPEVSTVYTILKRTYTLSHGMHVHKVAHVMTAISPAHPLLNIYNVHTQHLEQPHIFSSRSSLFGVMKAILVTSP